MHPVPSCRHWVLGDNIADDGCYLLSAACWTNLRSQRWAGWLSNLRCQSIRVGIVGKQWEAPRSKDHGSAPNARPILCRPWF
jgi:hypothetical protein